MQTIKRDIYVTKNVLQAPIEVTEGTNSIAIEFDVRDYDIPASAAAVAYSLSTSSMEEPNKALADVSGNKITIIPSEAFFLPGQNVMQIRIIDGNSKLISFNIIVKCTGKMRFGDEKEEQQSTLVEQMLAKLGEYQKKSASPYNFKGSCLSSELPASGNTINDTYYCTDLKYRKTWNGSAWEQSSLNEADYEDELTKTNGEVSSLKEDLDNQNAKHQTITKNVIKTGEYYWYQDGVKRPDREWISSVKHDVEEVSKVIIKYLSPTLYFDVYDFIDANGDVINHEYCTSSEDIINKIIVVPSNAKYFIISGESNTLNTYNTEFITEITNVIFNENYIKEDSIPKYLVRYWYGNNEIQETPDYLSGTEIVCENFDKVYISGTVDAWCNIYTFLDENRNVLSYSRNVSSSSINLDDFELSVPYNAYYLHVSSVSINFKGFLPISTKNKRMFDLNKKLNNNFNGVKMYWLGTSIPAGGADGLTSYYSYPKLVGRRLNANVTNLAVGSSPVHCRRQSLVSTNNPYGFIDSFESVSRCLTNTLEMCEWIINHYTMFSDAPSELSESLKTFIRSCSYENRIIPYLTEPSIWVFDHGFNDSMEDESLYSESDKFSTFTFRGACNFIFNLILSNQPKSIIYFVGVTTYENRVAQAEQQKIVANDWKLPFIELWNELGWSEKTISTKSGWINGIWTENVHTTPVTMTMRDVALPDGIHPHTDLTLGALNQIAMILSKWIDSNGYYQSIDKDDYTYFWLSNNLW